MKRTDSDPADRPSTSDVMLEELLADEQLPVAVREVLQVAMERVSQAEERAMRAVAEMENQRKRLEREQADTVRFAHEKILREMLEVYDSLVLCLSHADERTKVSDLHSGVELTLAQFTKALQSVGAEPIPATPGTVFDPAVHEAVMQDDHANLPPRSIVHEVQSGFWYRDRVLRPARVTVSTGRGHDAG